MSIAKEPAAGLLFEKWLDGADALSFLRENEIHSEFILYACLQNVYMHSVAVPVKSLVGSIVKDLDNWNVSAYSGWGTISTFSPPSTEVSPPLTNTGSKILDSGEQLIFAREFAGRVGEKHYHEILQKFIQLSGIHFIEERHAYCRFDRHGDVEDVLRIIDLAADSTFSSGTIITCDRTVLDRYLALNSSAIVRMFDFTRTHRKKFSGWHNFKPSYREEPDFFYRQVLEPGYASYVRGCQIVRVRTPKESLINNFGLPTEADQQYASFISHDWRHKRLAEISCAPEATANYFVESDLPFELSPVFFRPEVLAKYKADSDKYDLEERRISCRDAWHLQSYDVNEAGQVHTYLVYLRNLPYEEQLYWKAFNENPKGSISRRAFLSDFEGSWDQPYDALDSLKAWVRSRDSANNYWWKFKGDHLLDKVRYNVTESADEWANEILHLDQLIVEGFENSWLRKYALTLGRNPDQNYASIKLLKECLLGVGLAEDRAMELTRPFETVHYLRTKMKGHAASKGTIEKVRQNVLKEYGSFKEHFRQLCTDCDESLRSIDEQIR